MTKKKIITDRLDELFEEIHHEDPNSHDTAPAEENARDGEPGPGESGAGTSDAGHEQGESILTEESGPVPDVISAPAEEISADDLLEDVRRSLIEAEAQKEVEEKPKWWKRIGKGGRKEKKPDEIPPVVTAETAAEPALEVIQTTGTKQEEYVEQIDDLIDLLETEEVAKAPIKESSLAVVASIEEKMPVVEKEAVSVDELKKRVFSGSGAEDREENFSEVRAVALEGGEEVFVEVEVKTADPVEDRLKAFENALKPYMRYIYFISAFLGFVVIAVTSVLLYDAYRKSLPPEPVKEGEVLPYPVSMNLPGGLAFNLGRGKLTEEGRWDPRGAEWLDGTEICRWVAIPYSRQLEAVVRTLTREDEIELLMSNNDRLLYNVYSINQMTLDQMQEVSSNTPCLLLVLAESNTEQRWVVTAFP